MKRRSIVNAYRDILPDEAARERMLESILSNSSEISLAGKDDTMYRKKMKPVLIAAIIALMVILMGCAVAAFSLADMKIGDSVSSGDSCVNESGMTVTEPTITREAISLQGLAGSPGMLAAKEWFEFMASYDPDLTLLDESERNDFAAPEEYDAYSVYTQEMMDKVDEIAEKYGLKLAGPFADIQEDNNELFFEALGLDALHRTDANVDAEYLSGYFYDCGNFDFSFLLTLKGEGVWPDDILVTMRYNDKEYLDVVWASVSDIDQMEQWTYRTADGTDVLIVMGDEQARIFYDRSDAFVFASIPTYRWDENGENLYMTKADVEQVVDCINFAVKPQKPDMGYVKEKIAEYEAKRQEENPPVLTVEDRYQAFIRSSLEAWEHPEDAYYVKLDVNKDGIDDLLLGSRDQLNVIWSARIDEKSGNIRVKFITSSQVKWEELEEAWPNMDIRPITEYPMN